MQTEYIDITPTWSDILPAMIQVAVNGKNIDSVEAATGSLQQMARLADKVADLEQQNREQAVAISNLFEALKALLLVCDEESDPKRTPEMAIARAAINKATGREA